MPSSTTTVCSRSHWANRSWNPTTSSTTRRAHSVCVSVTTSEASRQFFCLIAVEDRLGKVRQSHVRPAEAHCCPGDDQLPHETAGTAWAVGHILPKFNID